MLKHKFIHLYYFFSRTTKDDWHVQKGGGKYLPESHVHVTGGVVVNLCLYSCIFDWVLPNPTVQEYPLLQWHPRLREEAALPDSLSPLALGTPPHTSIRVPSEISLLFPSRIATPHMKSMSGKKPAAPSSGARIPDPLWDQK